MIASVCMIRPYSAKDLSPAYHPPDPLPWARIAAPMAAAEDALARLDERLTKSPIRDGWIARTHFSDACAALWLQGAAVHLEDLVLHDSEMDVRAPTPELGHAHAVLRARRRILAAPPDWALSEAGLQSLRGRAGDGGDAQAAEVEPAGDDERQSIWDERVDGTDDRNDSDRPFAPLFAELDAAVRNAANAAVSAEPMQRARQAQNERSALAYDLDWDEDVRLGEWRAAVAETEDLPPTLAAAIAADAWDRIAPLEHAAWLGKLLAAALLRKRRKTQVHLACLHEGAQTLPYDRRRRARDFAASLVVQLEAIAAAAEAGLKAHDRWLIARTMLMRKLDGRRSSSRLPALLDYAVTRPVISAGMIAQELRITPRAAQNLVAELGLREATGRARYRAWGML
jgi:Protein of unknown function (DUF1612)/HTH DNA binding domain